MGTTWNSKGVLSYVTRERRFPYLYLYIYISDSNVGIDAFFLTHMYGF